MRNVTVSLEDELARWLRVQAAERDLSVSRYLRDLLHEQMVRSRSYEQAMTRSLARKPVRLNENGQPYPKRDELYD